MSTNKINLDIDLSEWTTITYKLPRHMVSVDVIVVNPTGQNTPIFICEDKYNYHDFDWWVYNDYDCKVVYWKYKDTDSE